MHRFARGNLPKQIHLRTVWQKCFQIGNFKMPRSESSLLPAKSNSWGCQIAPSQAAGRRGWGVTAPAPWSKDTYLNCTSEITVCPCASPAIKSCYMTECPCVSQTAPLQAVLPIKINLCRISKQWTPNERTRSVALNRIQSCCTFIIISLCITDMTWYDISATRRYFHFSLV